MTLREIREIGLGIDFPRASAKTIFQPLLLPNERNIFTVLQFKKQVKESTVGTIEFEPGTWALMFNWQGNSIVRNEYHKRPAIVPGRTIFFTRAEKMQVKVAKGEHDSTFILWKSDKLVYLNKWTEGWDRFHAYRPMPHGFQLLQSGLAKHAAIELRLTGIVYDTMAELISTQDHIDLNALPPDLPAVLQNLVSAVKKTPSSYWPVPEAAKLAGYSSHHFSRIFKQQVGYGFQSFVERCRTEMAIDLLRGTELTVDSVAEKSGFGATQALREALRELLGLMPSDIRPYSNR
jgi:AraC-like DNA-binding protein